MTVGSYDDFFAKLGFRESTNRYNVVNQYGSLGKYQMGEGAFVDIGLSKLDSNPFNNDYSAGFTGKWGINSVNDFLNSPEAQEKAIREYMALQFTYLQPVWEYDGQTINGVKISTSGMLAAAHLLGWDGAKAYLESGGSYVPADNFGTPITEYMQLMGDFQTPFTINHDLAETIVGGFGKDVLVGQGGDDALYGAGQDDRIEGGAGDDSVDGGDGTDTAVFAAAFNTFTISYDSVTRTYTLKSSATGTDTITNVEYFAFSGNVTKSAAELIAPKVTPTVAVTASNASLAEGNSATTSFSFVIRLSAASASAHTVQWSVTGSSAAAADAGDFASTLSGSVSFAAGETEKTVQVLVRGDTTVEASEGFTITLSSPTSGLTLGTASATATIANDDAAAPPPPTAPVPTSLTGTSGANTLNGGNGDETILGLGSNDTLNGNGGHDLLDGGTGGDKMAGGTGDDTYIVDSSSDTVTEGAGAGFDTIKTTLASFTLGSNIEALVYTGSGTFAGTGNSLSNTITGGNGNDTLNGAAGDDTLNGGNGNDTLNGGAGNDTYSGGSGTDTISFSGIAGGVTFSLAISGAQGTGGAGVDTLGAGHSIENATGGSGADTLTGDAGVNRLEGGDGADRLNGGLGADVLVGGSGKDVFVFNTALGAGNVDRTESFNVADDTLWLENNGIFNGLAAGALATGAFNTGSAATQADDRIIFNKSTGALYFDPDGSGGTAAVQFATLSGVSGTVGASDFLIV